MKRSQSSMGGRFGTARSTFCRPPTRTRAGCGSRARGRAAKWRVLSFHDHLAAARYWAVARKYFLNDPYYFLVDNFSWLLTLSPASFRVPIRPCPLSALKWGTASRGESVEV